MTVERVVETSLPTEWGTFRCVGYASSDGHEHVALVRGDPGDVAVPLVRLHSECLTGDVLGSRRCDCGLQLQESMRLVAEAGCGAVLYLRGHEGRGIGLLQKLRAYGLQDRGLDTVEANLELGHPADARDFTTGAEILADLGAVAVRLLTNNPAKRDGLVAAGIDVTELVPLVVDPTPDSLDYLATKRDRLGHVLPPVAHSHG
jgi:3,4-dihydroxy 2-butanone 4-phosphate synthase/GTP cyclohydrolase II